MPEQEPKKYQFHSPEFMILKEHFNEICDSYGLKPKTLELIDSTLAELSNTEIGIFGKINAFSKKLGDDPQKQDAAAAFVEICHSYVDRNPISDFGRLSKQSPFN